MTYSRILVCVDGEPHTETAVAAALGLARAPGARVDAIYVVDPYLKKFTHEICAAIRSPWPETRRARSR